MAKKAGLSFSQLHGLITERRYGSEEQRRAISEALDWKYEDLLKLGECLLEGTDYFALKPDDPLRDFIKVPFLDNGTPETESGFILVNASTTGRRSANQLRAFRFSDDCLEPMAGKGGLALIDLKYTDLKQLRHNSFYAFTIKGSPEVLVRQMEAVDKNLIALKSLDGASPQYRKPSELKLIGKVVWTCRDLP